MNALYAWAESLADRGNVTPDEVRLLVDTCQSLGHVIPAADRLDAPLSAASSGGLGSIDATGSSRLQSLVSGIPQVVDDGTSAEAKMAAVLPMCAFLRRCGPQYAGEIVPHILACIAALHTSHSRQYLVANRWQNLFTELLAQLHGVLQIEGLEEGTKQQISSAVASLIKRWLLRYSGTQAGHRSDADVAMMTGMKRAVREHRYPLPMLPAEASQLLRFLVDDFLVHGGPSDKSNSQGLRSTPPAAPEGFFTDDTALALGRHWSDDTALAFAGQLVAVAQAGGGLDPNVAHRLIASSCRGLRESLGPLLASVSGESVQSSKNNSGDDCLHLPSVSFVAATARLACDLAVDLLPRGATPQNGETLKLQPRPPQNSKAHKMNSPVRSQPPMRLPSVGETTTPVTNGTLLRSTSPPPPPGPHPRLLPHANGAPADAPPSALRPPEKATWDQAAAGGKLGHADALAEGLSGRLGLSIRGDDSGASDGAGLTVDGEDDGAQVLDQAMWEDDAAHQRLTEVGDIMLDVAEACLEQAWLHGLDAPDSERVLRLGTATITAASGLALAAATSAASANLDAVARVRAAMASAARLAELELGPASSSTPSARLLRWDLERPLTAERPGSEAAALELARALTEALCQVLARCWRAGLQPVVRASFVLFTDVSTYSDLGTTPMEAQVLLLTLGRLGVLLDGDALLLGWILPLLQDADMTSAPPQLPACSVHVLATLAAAAARAGHRGPYEKIVALLSVLYKSAHAAPVKYLLYRCGTPANGCPGAVAAAFLHMAKGLARASPLIRQDFHVKLLTLFGDLGSLAPPDDDAWGWDLGALLPAIAAVGATLPVEAQRQRLLSSGASFSYDTIAQLQEQDANLVKLYRLLWMYISLYKFAGVSDVRERYLWDPTWRADVGHIALNTPPIVIAAGTAAECEKLETELGERVARMGRRGSPPAIAASLMALVRPRAGAITVPMHSAARNAHLLATAVLNVSRVETAPLPGAEDLNPLLPLFAVQQVAQRDGWTGPWLAAITERCFDIYIMRLRGKLAGSEDDDAQEVDHCQADLGVLLARNLGSRAGETQLSELANSLLVRLLDSIPALHWSKPLMKGLLEAVDDEESGQLAPKVDGPMLPELEMVMKIVDRGAAAAPGSTEALMQEFLRGGQSQAGAAALRHAPAILSQIERGAARFCMTHLQAGLSGIQALNRKAHYGGLAEGLAEMAGNDRLAGDSVTKQATAELQEALKPGAPLSVLEDRYLTVAAALIAHPEGVDRHSLIRLIAWVPAQKLTPETMRLATFVWYWVTAAQPALQVPLVLEIAAAWEWTVQNRQGLFYNRFDADAHHLSRGGNPDDEPGLIEAISAHHVWLSFWLETWQILGSGTGSSAKVLIGILRYTASTSLQDAAALTQHPAAAGARFRLLLLCLLIARHQQGAARIEAGPRRTRDTLCSGILFQRVLRGALLWFAGPISWYGRFIAAEAREQAAAVDDFARLVEASAREWPSEVATPTTPPPQQVAPLAVPPPPAPARPARASAPDPVLGAAVGSNKDRIALLQLLLKYERERLQVWAEPLNTPAAVVNPYAAIGPQVWRTHTRAAWDVSPRLALSLLDRFPKVRAVRLEVEALLAGEAASPQLQALPRAADLLACAAADLGPAAQPLLEHLQLWAPAPLLQALEMMGGPAGTLTEVRAYALRSLQACASEEVVFFLPQLVQLLRGDTSGQIQEYLLTAASKSVLYAHILICCLKSEGRPPDEAFNPTVKRSGWQAPTDTGLWSIADKVCGQVWEVMPGEKKAHLEAELGFFDSVTNISGKLYPVPKDERKNAAVSFAKELKLPREDLYLPTNPDSTVLAVIPESATPMQSAAKVPILVAFKVDDAQTGGLEKVQSCIFKVGDDCRQDVLALQVIGLLKDAWQKAGLDLYLAPYGVIPTGYECGIIEVVPRCKSRSALGETADGGLYDIWRREFGVPGTPRFESARHNFIISEAGYAIACFLLQAKDRHNGNIMIDSDGHLVHIDFGFILGISPGGNLGFETAAFKLSHEMTQLLDPGGTRASPHFRLFQEMCIRAYLLARGVGEAIIASVSLMAESGLPCYGYGKPVEKLRERFHLEMTDAQAAAFMQAAIADSYDKWTTGFYDYVQYLQNRIPK